MTTIRIKHGTLVGLIIGAALLLGCTSYGPPPLPANNPADPQAGESRRSAAGFLQTDATTSAIRDRLGGGPQIAKGRGENMPGMQHQHEPGADAAKELSDQMKKTSEEMKQTSEALKEGTAASPTAFYYTCPMHPQIRESQPGKCPICGMTLVKKEGKAAK